MVVSLCGTCYHGCAITVVATGLFGLLVVVIPVT
jgi:hypothetical protein